MGKRFTDTEIWKKRWYRKLKPSEKVAFNYIKDNCDAVGVWVIDFEAAEFFIGSEVNWNSLIEDSNGNITILSDKKWWLADFCDFQYGTLKEECPPHRSYIALLKKHGLFKRVLKGYSKGINTPQEKEKDKDKELDKEKEKEREKDIKRVINCLNVKTESKYQNRGATREKIIARFNDGYTPEDLFRAIISMSRKWMGDEKMQQYLRPVTLFAPSKIDGYIAEYQREENDGEV